MKSLWRSVLLAALAALLTSSVASAQDPVKVTGVTIDKFQVLMAPLEGKSYRPLLRVTGTITCDADGPQDGQWPVMSVAQRSAYHIDNDSFGGVLCSTSPTPFTVTTESLECESTDAKEDCLQRGTALVRVWLSGEPDLAHQRVTLRR